MLDYIFSSQAMISLVVAICLLAGGLIYILIRGIEQDIDGMIKEAEELEQQNYNEYMRQLELHNPPEQDVYLNSALMAPKKDNEE